MFEPEKKVECLPTAQEEREAAIDTRSCFRETTIEPAKRLPEVLSTVGALRQQHPHGHPSFIPTSLREIKLHSAKSHDYASGGHVFGNFQRVSAILALYPDLDLANPKVVALVYMLKQLDCVFWALSNSVQLKVEGLGERLADISVYSKIIAIMCEEETQDAPNK